MATSRRAADDGLVEITATHYLPLDGELLAPGQKVRVTAERAETLRASGYAASEVPPLRGIRDPDPVTGLVDDDS